MKSNYEHTWQEAMAGATIEPSEALWNNITSKLDSERGRNYWVTLLLIAATVTLAFAVPLTIGTSTYEARPDQHFRITQRTETPTIDNEISNSDKQYLNDSAPKHQNTKTQISNEQLAIGNEQSTNSNEQYQNNSVPKHQNTYNNEQLIMGNGQSPNSSVAKNQNTKTPTNNNTLEQKPNSQTLLATDYKGLLIFNTLGNTQLAEIESYYMVPYFLPVKKEKALDNSLLASLNMGTGNVSTKSGLLDLKSEQAYDNITGDPHANRNDLTRSQNAGTAYYVGGGVEIPIGKRWSFLASLGYRLQVADGQNNIVMEENGSYKPLGIYAPLTSGTAFLSNSYSYTVSNQYLSIPITFKYPFINRRFKLRGGFGVTTDLMLAHKVSSDSYGSASYKPAKQGYRPMQFAGVINFDVSYSLTNQYAVAFETGYRRGFTTIDEEREFYPSSFSAGIILFYKIK